MSYTKANMFYEGKAKRLYDVKENKELVFHEFKDSLTAFNGVKKAEMGGKGKLNRDISSLIFKYLNKNGIPSHWVANDGDIGMITKRVKIIPLEVVVRNVVAGSLAKKFSLDEGSDLARPVVDLHFKDDALGDPFISDDYAIVILKAVSEKELTELKKKALEINDSLKKFFAEVGLKLIDFKLEFGKTESGEIVLADEISPDTCRLWDLKTGEKRDKDRFRRDLGQVIESYEWVWNQLNKRWGTEV